MNARQLRNRVLTILDRDDNMQEVDTMIHEDEPDWAPSIMLKQAGKVFLITFMEVELAKKTARTGPDGGST